MKIPPRSMFVSQIYGTVIGGIINFWVLKLILISKRPYLDGTMDDPTGQVCLVFDISKIFFPVFFFCTIEKVNH